MFTGIIECMGRVEAVERQGGNRTFTLLAPLLGDPVHTDQSIAHDGVCLTVTKVLETAPQGTRYTLTAVAETLLRTTLQQWEPGTVVNVERCLRVGDRLDGHFVQGHVDTTGRIIAITDADGSWVVEVKFSPQFAPLLVPKGSICLNGVSLTVATCTADTFSVAIIPYTWAHTTFQRLGVGDSVNLEFDILGKYLLRKQALASPLLF